MFKELKVIKIAIFLLIIILVIIINKQGQGLPGVFQTQYASYFPADSIQIKIKLENEENPVQIKNSWGDEVYTTSVQGKVTRSTYLFEKIESGESYDTILKVNKTFEHGLYWINDKFPLIIKPNHSTEVSLIFPYINNMIYRSTNDSTFITGVDLAFSSSNPSEVTEADANMFNLLADNQYDFGLYADDDLNKYEGWKESKLIIVAGKTKFYTQPMMDNLLRFSNDGGNILFLTDEISKYKLVPSENGYHFNLFNKVEWEHLWLKWPFVPYTDWEVHDDKVVIIDKQNFGDAPIPVISSAWNCLFLKIDSCFYNAVPIASITMKNTTTNEWEENYLGYVNYGRSDGKLLTIGSECWLQSNNLSVPKSKQFVLDCIDFLIKN